MYYQNPAHIAEWQLSAIDDDIIRLNLQSLEGEDPYEFLLYSKNISRRNDGRLRDGFMRRYSHLSNGGWWCGTIDPINWVESMWGCFKPDSPAKDGLGKKTIKYEHPPREATEIFLLKISATNWERIARKNNYDDNYIDLKLRPLWDGKSDDEIAIAFWQWVKYCDIPITITEGAKKAASLLSAGYVAIALPGIDSGYRSPKDSDGNLIGMMHLIPQLQVFMSERNFYFAFDQDSKLSTQNNVSRAIKRTGSLFNRNGCKTYVCSWKNAKGADDLIHDFGISAIDDSIKSAIDLETWKIAKMGELSKPATMINSRYLGNLDIPDDAKIIGIKSAKGTGKTESLIREVEKAHANGQRVLLLTHRVQLGLALCSRFNIPYVSELKDSEEGTSLGYGLCIDSLRLESQARFKPNDWHNAILIIDECEQVLWHLFNANTEVSRHRVKILSNFKQLVQNILSSANGKIYLSDADLCDISLNYIENLAGFKVKTSVIVNEFNYSDEGKLVFSYDGNSPDALINELLKHIEEDGKPYVCCSGQKTKSQYGTKNLEALIFKNFPNLRILRIDSESISDPNHPAFGCIENVNQVVNGYDVVITSPSTETGISIDIREHFTAVFGIFSGIQSCDSVRQALARVRDNIPRIIWAAKTAMRGSRIGNGATSPAQLLRGQHIQTKSAIALLTSNLEFDDKFQSESLLAWAYRACLNNFGMINYRKSILEGLESEGYIIDVGDIHSTENLTKELRNFRYEIEAQAIANAPNISASELEKLIDQKSKTEPERFAEKKAKIKKRYLTDDVTADLIKLDDNGWYPQIKLHYYLSFAPEQCKSDDQLKAEAKIAQGEGAIWKPDFNKGQFLAKVQILEALKIKSILDNPGEQLHGESQIAVEIAEMAIKNRGVILNYLGLTIRENDKPIKIIQMLLGKIGLKLTFLCKQGSRGEQKRIYSYEPTDDGRADIFAKWLEVASVVTPGKEDHLSISQELAA